MMGRQRGKRKGGNKERVFGCDLLEHLQSSGQDIPQVLKSCSEFVEKHGIVDGIYRLSGVSSNIQKLRSEFDTENTPDLNKDVYLQDIHCVSSTCKAYFRELPNPLLTYQLYDKFADAVAVQLEEERLVRITEVLKELPRGHHRTLEFLMQHLVRMASFSAETNMHSRNLAIVWAPNLLRSKDIEATGFNGTAAFMEVRVQSIVVEFILMHVDQLFNDAGTESYYRERRKSLPSPTINPEEPFFRSFPIPSQMSPGDAPPPIRPYHAIIEVPDTKRKGSIKAKKWKSIFNLGRSSNETKRKGKTEEKEKVNLRPAKSMDSLSSQPYASDGAPRSPSQIPMRHDSFGRTEPTVNTSSQLSAPGVTPSFMVDPSTTLGMGYAVTYRRGGGASVSVVSPGSGVMDTGLNTSMGNLSSLMGGLSSTDSVASKSPKNRGNRAEKCVGMHITGPFSVTVPLHITSGLALGVLHGANNDLDADKPKSNETHKTSDEVCTDVKLNHSNNDLQEKQTKDEESEEVKMMECKEKSFLSESESTIKEDQLQQEDKTESHNEESEAGESSSNGGVEEEEEEENPDVGDEPEYMDMRADVFKQNTPENLDLPFDLQETFGFLDESDILEPRNGMQFEEFSVEPPCYEDEEYCTSFGSEMYEPAFCSLPILPKQGMCDEDKVEDEEFQSIPGHLYLNINYPQTEIFQQTDVQSNESEKLILISNEADSASPNDEVEEVKETVLLGNEQLKGQLSQSSEYEPITPMMDEGSIVLGDAEPTQEITKDLETANERPVIDDPPRNLSEACDQINGLLLEAELMLKANRHADRKSHPTGDSLSSNNNSDMPQSLIVIPTEINFEKQDDVPDIFKQQLQNTRLEQHIHVQDVQFDNDSAGWSHDPLQFVDVEHNLITQQCPELHLCCLSPVVSEIPEVEKTIDVLVDTEGDCHSSPVVMDIQSEPPSAEYKIMLRDIEDPPLTEVNSDGRSNYEFDTFDGIAIKSAVDGENETAKSTESMVNPRASLNRQYSVILSDTGDQEDKEAKTKHLEQELTAHSAENNEDILKPEDSTKDKIRQEFINVEEMPQGLSGTQVNKQMDDLALLQAGGAPMQLVSISSSMQPKLYQVKSVPVVPPKPQFSKLPPALQLKHQKNEMNFQRRGSECEGEIDSDGEGKVTQNRGSLESILESTDHAFEGGVKRSSRNAGAPLVTSLSFDEAVARARDRHPNFNNKSPVRRIHTYTDQSHNLMTFTVTPRTPSHALCDISIHSPNSENAAKRLSLPRLGPRNNLSEYEDMHKEHQRRSLMETVRYKDKE
ncbi:uncharacterized protein LOC120518769 [Polypterus senegalus]|uniref:uncharacterized protein LOC120518769 n=1 Tax=Polypterus senegalus TaxID=55291 RepID=UPI001962B2AF|nr:uncharacterized protein LOC120518769 [Polypterus senegalus]